MATKRTPPDWEAIEREYRVGQTSVAQLSRQYKVSRAAIDKHMAKRGIKRDLSDQVRAATNATVQRGIASQSAQDADAVAGATSRVTDADLVAAAAARGADVVLGHIRELTDLEQELAQLKRLIRGWLGIDGAPRDIDVGTPEVPRPISLDSISFGKGDGLANILRARMDVLERKIRLQRQALNLDNEDKDKGKRAPDLIIDVDPDLLK
jgi:hypothetical protein